MKMKLIALLLTLPCLSLTAQRAVDEPARDIVARSQELTRLDGSESVSYLEIYDARGNKKERKIAGMSKRDPQQNLEKKIMRFLAPPEVKGTGLLTFDHDSKDDDRWLYMPALRKTRRIVSSEKAKNFMGSEFSYADMSYPNLDEFSYRLTGRELVGTEECLVVEITPLTDAIADEYGFSRKISSFSVTDGVIRKSLYFGLDGQAHKELVAEDVQLVDQVKNKFKAMRMTIRNLQNGRKSIYRIDSIRSVDNPREDYFSVRFLENE